MHVVFEEKLSSKAFLPEAVSDGPRIDRAEVALVVHCRFVSVPRELPLQSLLCNFDSQEVETWLS
jgi:hypothetical protein